MRRTGRWARQALRWLAGLALLIVLAAAAIAIALQVTPMQTVTVAGQVIQVGASAPDLSLSGPGEVDLFGQSLPTDLRFTGPVRPRLQLSQITINSELTTFVEGARPDRRGTHTRRPARRRVEALLHLGDGDRRGGRADPGGGGRGLAPPAALPPRSSCWPPGWSRPKPSTWAPS